MFICYILYYLYSNELYNLWKQIELNWVLIIFFYNYNYTNYLGTTRDITGYYYGWEHDMLHHVVK